MRVIVRICRCHGLGTIVNAIKGACDGPTTRSVVGPQCAGAACASPFTSLTITGMLFEASIDIGVANERFLRRATETLNVSIAYLSGLGVTENIGLANPFSCARRDRERYPTLHHRYRRNAVIKSTVRRDESHRHRRCALDSDLAGQASSCSDIFMVLPLIALLITSEWLHSCGGTSIISAISELYVLLIKRVYLPCTNEAKERKTVAKVAV
ncbi:hypothetical protein EVAR_90311_1 [Eumeta japonica]|uniref:Uncharacterized protein n=1 Tax=Eumeta variegata TaxID=151549 RepID=A0A4C1ZPJ2_EUMVA|nr:hypothetical protein EVAR_90311_1 [Eumeta japonica]